MKRHGFDGDYGAQPSPRPMRVISDVAKHSDGVGEMADGRRSTEWGRGGLGDDLASETPRTMPQAKGAERRKRGEIAPMPGMAWAAVEAVRALAIRLRAHGRAGALPVLASVFVAEIGES